ncbi:hypothetical protein AYX14_05861 [Cryptococcus neoformans]|nr:hypothetical protein AYX14_05861 [Cryptococcus neoformans var. grubii]
MWPFPLSFQPDYRNSMPQPQPPLPQHNHLHAQPHHHHSPASRHAQRPEYTDQGNYDYTYLFRPDQHHSYDPSGVAGSGSGNQQESNRRTGASPSSTPWSGGGPYTATSGIETSWDWYARQQNQGSSQQQQRDPRSAMGFAQERLTGSFGWPESRNGGNAGDGYGHSFYGSYAGIKKEDKKDGERGAKKPKVDAPINVENELAQLKMHLDEIICLIKPFASQKGQPAPEQPPPYLSTRFARLSSVIHESLQNLSPHIHLNLSPEFVPTYQRPEKKGAGANDGEKRSSPALGTVGAGIDGKDLTKTKTPEELAAAEKEMEIIKNRRDALIAKAQAALARGGTPKANSAKGGKNVSKTTGGKTNKSSSLKDNSTKSLPLFTPTPPVPPLPSLLNHTNFEALTGGSEFTSSFLPPITTTISTTMADRLAQVQPVVQQTFPQDSMPFSIFSQDSMAWLRRCHGCGSSVTSEWRTGPDGPDSLCDICGMHYERLSRKKDLLSFPQPAHFDGDTAFVIGS